MRVLHDCTTRDARSNSGNLGTGSRPGARFNEAQRRFETLLRIPFQILAARRRS